MVSSTDFCSSLVVAFMKGCTSYLLVHNSIFSQMCPLFLCFLLMFFKTVDGLGELLIDAVIAPPLDAVLADLHKIGKFLPVNIELFRELYARGVLPTKAYIWL